VAQLRTTGGGAYAKYNAPLEAMVKDAIKTGKNILHTGKNVRLKNTKKNLEALQYFLKNAHKGTRELLNENLLETKDGKLINFGSFEKPKFRAVANKGDVAEGVFAAALYSRFLKREAAKVSTSDLKKILTRLKSKMSSSGKISLAEITDKVINANGVVYDNTKCRVGLAKSNMLSLMDTSLWNSELKEIFDASLRYANSKAISDFVEMIYYNNQENVIEILSVGTEDQRGTKVDVSIVIDDKKMSGISLKVGTVKQFGQLGGTDFEKHSQLWEALGISIKSLEKKYYTLLGKKQVNAAFDLIYDHAAKQKIDGGKLADFVEHHGTLRENGVTLVQLSADTKSYDFSKLKKVLGEITTEKKNDSKGKPFIIFKSTGTPVLRIRMKIENKTVSKRNPLGLYIRTYIEKEKGMTDLIAETIS